jgi:hypothetical protein
MELDGELDREIYKKVIGDPKGNSIESSIGISTGSCIVLCGLVLFGVVWCGLVWFGVILCDVVWCSLVLWFYVVWGGLL